MGNHLNCCHADQDDNNYTMEQANDEYAMLKSGRRDITEV